MDQRLLALRARVAALFKAAHHIEVSYSSQNIHLLSPHWKSPEYPVFNIRVVGGRLETNGVGCTEDEAVACLIQNTKNAAGIVLSEA